MEYRTFWDSEGRSWQVWLVLPCAAERRAAERRVASGSTYSGTERRRGQIRRPRALRRETTVPIGFEAGWLCFECATGERRRLAPVPAEWEASDAAELSRLCDLAAVVLRCEPS